MISGYFSGKSLAADISANDRVVVNKANHCFILLPFFWVAKVYLSFTNVNLGHHLENKGPKKAELIDVILVRNGEQDGNKVKSALELENNSKPRL